MRSSVAQRLLSSLFASTSGRGVAALPPAWPAAAGAAADAASTCGLPLQPHQAARTCACLIDQPSPCGFLPVSVHNPSSHQLGLDFRLTWAGQTPLRAEQRCLPAQQQRQWRCLHASLAPHQDFVSLNNLADNEGARRWVSSDSGHMLLSIRFCMTV